MKLSQVLNDALNAQAMHEYRNMLIYKQMESVCENFQLKNLAAYFKKQAQEEKTHGDKFVDYINDRTGGNVLITGIEFPDAFSRIGIENLGDTYIAAEELTTASIEELYQLALDENSFLDLPFLQEMLAEQVSEEDEANKLALNLSMCKDIVLFDKTLEE